LDIYLEVKQNNPEIEDKIFDNVWKIGFDNEIVITTIIFTREEIENGPMKFSPIYKSVMRDGIVV